MTKFQFTAIIDGLATYPGCVFATSDADATVKAAAFCKRNFTAGCKIDVTNVREAAVPAQAA